MNWLVRYIYGLVRQEELVAFYRDAAIGLITPLRDGMNLVAKVCTGYNFTQPNSLQKHSKKYTYT